MSLINPKAKPLLFVVSAPAGTGKSTLVDRLVEEFSHMLVETCSVTTRLPRAGEKDGKHYHFVDQKAFKQRVDAGDFVEHVELHGHLYGTLREDVERISKEGKHAILVIDTQGARRIQESGMEAIYLFLAAPSMEDLKKRLISRGTETIDQIDKRLAIAEKELEASSSYHYRIVNDDLDTAYQKLKSVLIAETHKVKHL
jgi:guanylate kinase